MDLDVLPYIWSISLTIVILLTLFLINLYFKPRQNVGYPPLEKGWIPWLGCALEFGKAPLSQIRVKQKQLGEIFTLYIAGKRMTFITEQVDFSHFFQSPNVNFQEAVAEPVQHTAGIPRKAFFMTHTKLHDMVKGRLSSQSLHQIVENLSAEFCQEIHQLDSNVTGNLQQIVQKLMYQAVINNLFGRNVLTSNQEDFELLTKHFTKFDLDFEYGSQLPECLLRDWSASKHWLLDRFKSTIQKTKTGNNTDNKTKTVFQSLLETVGPSESHSFGLLFLWSSLANAIPMSFWTLANIVNNPVIFEQVKADIHRTFGAYKEGRKVSFTEAIDRDLVFVRWCVLETIRLYSPGTVARKVIKSLKIREFIIPEGDMLLLSPYWAHRNPQYFPEPNKFIPNRWKDFNKEKKDFLDGFVAFGQGRYQCPGRWFALQEIYMFVCLFLWKYDVILLDGLPKESMLHLVGTQQPEKICPVKLSLNMGKGT